MKKFALFFTTLPFMLTSCGGLNSIPKKGYELVKAECAAKDRTTPIYNSCKYVYITNEEGGIVHYRIFYTVFSKTEVGFFEYGYWDKRDSYYDYVRSETKRNFEYYCSEINSGRLTGQIGYL